jgi:hypothetical protein
MIGSCGQEILDPPLGSDQAYWMAFRPAHGTDWFLLTYIYLPYRSSVLTWTSSDIKVQTNGLAGHEHEFYKWCVALGGSR